MSGHAGGDNRLIHDFLSALSEEEGEENLKTNIDVSVQSHLIAAAAEYSRIHQGASVDIQNYLDEEKYKDM